MFILPNLACRVKMRSGYTLPVFAIAAAKAAILRLNIFSHNLEFVSLDLLESGNGEIAIAQSALLGQNAALGITISDPGDNLDLTSGTAVWALVNLEASTNSELHLVSQI